MGLGILIMGCGFLLLAGNALTRFKDTRDARWATAGIFEILIGGYFVIAAIGTFAK